MARVVRVFAALVLLVPPEGATTPVRLSTGTGEGDRAP